MKKHLNKFSSILLYSIAATTTLTCCSVVKTISNYNFEQGDDNTPLDPKYLDYNDGVLYGLKKEVDGKPVTMEDIFLNGYEVLDLRTETLGENITEIAPYAFANVFFGGDYGACTIRTLILPQSIKKIGQGAFYDCTAFTNQLFLPEGLETIEQDAFFYNGFTGDLKIPDTVTTIGTQAFWHLDTLTGTLTIPTSVEKVGYRAFQDLHQIETIDLSGYSHIPTWLYTRNSIFHGVATDEGIQPGVATVFKLNTKENAMDDWQTVLSGKDGQGVGKKAVYQSVIGDVETTEDCFKYEDSIKKEKVLGFSDSFDASKYTILKFPSSVKEIADKAFKNKITTHKLKFQFGKDQKLKIGKEAFSGCTGLMYNNMTIPFDVTMGDQAFYGCTGLTGMITFPSVPAPTTNATYDLSGNEVFRKCTSISGIVAKPRVYVKGYGVFQDCSSLATLDFTSCAQERVVDLEEYWPRPSEEASQHLSLNDISPCGVFYFASDAIVCTEDDIDLVIKNMSNIDWSDAKMAKVGDTKTKWKYQKTVALREIDEFEGYILKNDNHDCCGIKSSVGDVTEYTHIRIPSVVTSIEKEAFKNVLVQKKDDGEGNINRWKLSLNLGITQIKESAFEGCNGIMDQLIIPSSVETIGDNAFNGCYNVDGVLELPSSIKSIGKQSFKNTRISKVIFNENIKTIGDYAFQDSRSMKEIDLTCFSKYPSDLTIGDHAFSFGSSTDGGKIYVNDVDSWEGKIKNLPDGWSIVEA